MTQEQVLAFLISASLGALIGLERQWEDQQAGRHTNSRAGLRTFVLWAVLGTTSAYIDKAFAYGFYPFGFGAMVVMLITHIAIGREGKPALGLTTVSTALMTFFIGSLAFWGQTRLSLVLAVSIILLLSAKHPIHRWSQCFTQEDVRLALQFMAITGVILPMAPNRSFGPYGAFNPFSIWLMVVLVVGLGFFGYMSVRLFGTKAGLGTLGVLGGLTSSTVTTLAFSRQSKQRPELTPGLALGIVSACTVMLARVAILVGAVSSKLLEQLWPALLAMCLPGVLYGAWRWVRQSPEAGVSEPPFKNPLSLKIALQFAALYALVVLFSRAALAKFGDTGLSVVSFISGLTDMDAITLSLSHMSNAQQVVAAAAANGIIIAAVSNTLLKLILALSVGGPNIRRPLLAVFGATMACGLAVWIWRTQL